MAVATRPLPPVADRAAPLGHYVVVGGGLSGIAATYYLRERGYSAELVEQAGRLGGRSQSAELGSRTVTFGGKNIGRRYTCFREFTRRMGYNPYEFFGINSSRVDNGEIRTVDSSRRWRSIARFARRAPLRDVLRFGHLALRVRSKPENRYLGSAYFDRLAEELDSRPLSHYFSEAVCTAAIRPLTVRMNGAEPDEAYIGNFGSNLGTLLDTFDQLSLGIHRVFEQFEALGQVRLNTTVESLLVESGCVGGVRVTGPEGHHEELPADGVVVAAPAHTAASLLGDVHPQLAESLTRVNYFPAAVAIAEYEREIFSPEVRALVFDADEPLSNAGSYGADDRHIVRYTFSGRTARQHLGEGVDAESLLSLAEERLGRYFPVSAAERRGFVSRRWDAAYSAYLPFHSQFRDALDRALGELPGLYLTGDYLRGASIEACFRAARDCADRVVRVAARA